MAINGTVTDYYALPDSKTLQAAGDMQILDEQGNKTSFRSLYADTADGISRHLIVFIRHFFCGQCEEYTRALAHSLSPATLAAATPPTRITLIGCGHPSFVADYKKRTGCPYTIYCDPDRALYAKLDMVSSLELGDRKPEYITTGFISGSMNSFVNLVGSGIKALTFQGGKFTQNGGEWVFEDGELKWCKRMKNTRDHAEIAELKEVLAMTQ